MGFLFVSNASATVIYSQNIADTYRNITNKEAFTTSGGEKFGSTQTVGSIQLHGGWGGSTIGPNGCAVYVAIVTSDSVIHYTNSITTDTLLYGGSLGDVLFPLSTSSQFSLASVGITDIFWSYSGGGICASISGSPVFAESNTDTVPNAYFVDNTSHDMTFTLFDDTGSVLGTSVQLRNPPFVPGMSTSDFYNWQVRVNLQAPHSSISAINILVNYGTTTAMSLGQTNYKTYYGDYFSVASGAELVNYDMYLRKTSPLPTSAIYTQVVLTDQNDATIATSSILSFTVHPGPQTPVPDAVLVGTIVGSVPPPFCPETSFSLTGVDFGKGICEIFSWVFVPKPETLQKYAQLGETLKVHAPFSYYYQATDGLSNLTVSSTTMTGLSINTGSSTPIRISADLFSSATIDKYTSPTSRNVVRTLIQWAMYLSFLSMVILEVRHLFRGKPQQQ